MADRISENMQYLPESVPEQVPDTMPKKMAGRMSKYMPSRMSNKMWRTYFYADGMLKKNQM